MSKRKQMIIRVVALVLVLFLVLGVVVSAILVFAEAAPARDTYKMDIYYDEGGQAARVNEALTYTNRTGTPLTYVSFHLYPNAFRDRTTVPFEDNELADAFPVGYAPGGVDFVSVKVNGEATDWGISGDGEQFLRVGVNLSAGTTVEFEFVYAVLMPSCGGKFGVDPMSARLVDFYPIAAVYDTVEEEFALVAEGAVGEPLYRDAADYHVTLNAPETYRLASTGEVTSEPVGGGRTLFTIEAPAARDFAMALGRKYTAYEKDLQGVPLRALTNDASAASAALDIAADALTVYQGWFGAYPFGKLDIAQVDDLPDGAARTGLILLDGVTLTGDRNKLRLQIARLVARQYFSCAVGSDQVEEPWLSEALSGIAALLYIEERDGHDAYLSALNAQVLPSLNLTLPGGLYVDSELSRFTEKKEYAIAVIDRGVAAMHEVRDAMGRDAFMKALGRYVQDNALKNASIIEFAAALDASSDKRWDDYLMDQLRNIGDYAEQGLDWLE